MLKFHNSDLWIAWLVFFCLNGKFYYLLLFYLFKNQTIKRKTQHFCFIYFFPRII